MTIKKGISLALLVIGVVALGLVPRMGASESLLNLLILMFIYTMLATSWNILGGYTGQVNLGHAAFFGLGTLTARMLYTGGCPLPLAFLVAGVVPVVFSMLIGVPAFRLRLRGDYFTIGTLALSQILYITIGNVLPKITYLPMADIQNYQILPRYYIILALTVFTIGVAYALVKSRLGLGLVAVRENEDAAESLGVNAFAHKLLALAVSAFLGGLTGGAYAYYQPSYYFNYTFSPPWSLEPVTMTFIGGVGTVHGPVIGAIFFVLLKEWLVLRVGEYHLIIFGVLFILVVLFLPGGLVEAWERIRRLVARRTTVKATAPTACAGGNNLPGN
ncbi:MAG: branched-chain amino acid ABC transporter permease [Anaerolineae bacterium]|nr:branched-chain amino acid ABC transporter permease [Anaerolineae bacterium]MDW8069681.1 branched-chain amino acid ABC transporter permease [Anaerolineae bacterium]